ncbi:MAG: ribonuclease III [Sphingopyxis sp.]
MSELDLSPLLSTLGVVIGDQGQLITALTHGSHNARGGNSTDYQRLEFLGDRVLGLAIADAIFRRFPMAKEGELSARLNVLVSGATCAEIARDIDLAPYIRLGKQARDDGARDSDNILGDVMEAIIGAIYLDAGMDEARALVLRLWAHRLDGDAATTKHPKSALLEWAAAHKRKPPAYTIIARDGPDHAPRYAVSVNITHVGEASAAGSSKQEAETAAAAALLAILEPEK